MTFGLVVDVFRLPLPVLFYDVDAKASTVYLERGLNLFSVNNSTCSIEQGLRVLGKIIEMAGTLDSSALHQSCC